MKKIEVIYEEKETLKPGIVHCTLKVTMGTSKLTKSYSIPKGHKMIGFQQAFSDMNTVVQNERT